MSEGLEQLANTLKTYEAKLYGCKRDSGAIIQLLLNWQVPILKDFGVALEQVIGALAQVASTSEAALNLADQTYCGESLTSAATLSLDLREALVGIDMPQEARDTMEALLEVLDPWAGEDEDEDEGEDKEESLPESQDQAENTVEAAEDAPIPAEDTTDVAQEVAS